MQRISRNRRKIYEENLIARLENDVIVRNIEISHQMKWQSFLEHSSGEFSILQKNVPNSQHTFCIIHNIGEDPL